jgi:hypothetical protein
MCWEAHLTGLPAELELLQPEWELSHLMMLYIGLVAEDVHLLLPL